MKYIVRTIEKTNSEFFPTTSRVYTRTSSLEEVMEDLMDFRTGQLKCDTLVIEVTKNE